MAHLMAEPPNVRLKLSNRSENVLLVREMLTGVAETIALESSDLYDIRTAVTEACNNVVLHAPVEHGELASTTALTIAPAKLARAVLPRILSVLAARAHFSTDRISDAQLVADSLAAHAPSSLGADRLNLTVSVNVRSLELR